MERFKLAYIGAGSFRFSLGFFRNIINATELLPMEVALCDVNEKSLKIMTKILKRMVKKGSKKIGYDENEIKVTSSSNRRHVLENADFVYKSISVGIQAAEWYDNYLPIKFGIPQNTGDTVGPGGLFRGLRTNPVVAEIAKDMKELCPNAPLLNYTNPQATIVMAAKTVAPDIEYIGLCHELFGGLNAMHKFANKMMSLNVPSRWDFDVEYAGVNHFAWFTKVEYGGQDLYPALREKAMDAMYKNIGGRGFNFYLLDKHNWFPYPGSRHVAEFLPDYYNYFNHEIQCPHWSFPVIRNVWGLGFNRRTSYWGFKAMAKGIAPVPGPRKKGEHAMEMTLDWRDNNPKQHVVNLMNNGTVPELPDDCVVEVPGRFKDGKMVPVGTVHLPDNVADLVRPHAEQHRLTVDAALGNDIDLVIKAMKHDPMAKWIEDEEKLEYLTKLMLYYQQDWLPEKWQEWIPTKSELKKSKWWVGKKDLSKWMFRYKKVKFPPKPELKKKAFFWDKRD